MKVNWNDLQRPESSGSFPYRGGTITVGQEEIDVWRARPDALFTVRGFRLWTNKPQYVSSLAATSCRTSNGRARLLPRKSPGKMSVALMVQAPMPSETGL